MFEVGDNPSHSAVIKVIGVGGGGGNALEHMISEGVNIIDVGINRVNDESEKGYHLTGDVHYNSVLGIANSITPVPGGVGPMTRVALLQNTLQAAAANLGIDWVNE